MDKFYYSIKGSDVEGWTLMVYKHHTDDFGIVQDYVYPYFREVEQFKTFDALVGRYMELTDMHLTSAEPNDTVRLGEQTNDSDPEVLEP